MFCLRSWLPLLFIPTNASPTFIMLFFICTYFLNRPCVYCSFLLLILFLTSCNWSDRCFFDFSSNWFQPRFGSSPLRDEDLANSVSTADGVNVTTAEFVWELVNNTAATLAAPAAAQLARTRAEWSGLGIEWIRSLLGRREWRIECLDVNIRL